LSLSRKEKLNEKIIQDNEILRNEKKNAEAKSFFVEKEIDDKIQIWSENCKYWLFQEFIPDIINQNFLNIYDIDQHLKINYCKSLQEYDLIVEDRNRVKNSNDYPKISLDELIKLHDLSKINGFSLEIMNSFHFQDQKKIKDTLNFLITQRKKLDLILHIPNLDVDDDR
jgi:hypothetical protein